MEAVETPRKFSGNLTGPWKDKEERAFHSKWFRAYLRGDERFVSGKDHRKNDIWYLVESGEPVSPTGIRRRKKEVKKMMENQKKEHDALFSGPVYEKRLAFYQSKRSEFAALSLEELEEKSKDTKGWSRVQVAALMDQINDMKKSLAVTEE